MTDEQARGIDHLKAFIGAFMVRETQERYLALCKTETGLAKACKRLSRLWSSISASTNVKEVGSADEAMATIKTKWGIGPDAPCYVITTHEAGDCTLAEALQVADQEFAAVVSIRKGELAYYAGDLGRFRLVMWRTK